MLLSAVRVASSRYERLKLDFEFPFSFSLSHALWLEFWPSSPLPLPNCPSNRF